MTLDNSERSGVPARAEPRDLATIRSDDVLGRVQVALWVFDFESARILWANAQALKLWDSDSIEDLRKRDLHLEMSASVKLRLTQHREDFELDPAREINELWTLYPQNKPFRVQAILRRYDLPTGRFGMMVEARPQDITEPETIRSADALLHAQTIVALYDQSGRSLYSNPAFRRTFGPGDHVFGAEFASPADLLDCMEGLAERGEHRRTVLVHTRAGERWLDIHVIRCKDAVTGDGAFLANMSDVTTARLHQQELARARDIAETAVRARSQFLSAVSHEMRTPLNGVLGMASVLAKSELGEEQRKMLDVVTMSGEKMLDVVEHILHLAEIDSGAVQLREEPFSPALLVDAVAARERERIERKGIRLIASSQIDRATEFMHDPGRIKQVLRHLIDNAHKFTDHGYVSVRATLRPGGELTFDVGDTGPGIPGDAVEKIFDRFFQLDGTCRREYGGAGIGLSICHALVTLWGGRIWVSSEPGRGSVFSFTVPAAMVPDDTADPDRPDRHLRIVGA